MSKILIELHSSFLHSNSFFTVLENGQRVVKIFSCGQSDVSECLMYWHILKSIVKELNKKIAKIMFITFVGT